MNNIVNIYGIKYFLLDVDGLLVDSERIFNKCWIEGAKLCGFEMTFEQALQLRSCDSKLAQQLFEDWYGDKKAYQRVRGERKRLMAEGNNCESPSLKPGIDELLAKLKEVNIKYAIVSSSPVERCRGYLKKVGISDKFDTIVSAEMVKRGKPFPDVYLLACSQLGIKPKECVAVEDSPNGLTAAHDAGCSTIMIPDLSQYSDNLEAVVDYCFDSLDKIILGD